jgi:hypothetical protein
MSMKMVMRRVFGSEGEKLWDEFVVCVFCEWKQFVKMKLDFVYSQGIMRFA